jgi:hypothetical protein
VVLAAVSATLLAGSVSASARTVVAVDCSRGGDLQSAIDNNDDATILIRGRCSGQFVITNRSLTLRGTPGAVLDGEGTGPALLIEADGPIHPPGRSVIQAMRVTNGRPGIVVAGGTSIYPVSLEDVIVSGNDRGSGTILGRFASGIELIRATLTLVASSVSNNGGEAAGPGIYASDSNIYTQESIISRNAGAGIQASFTPMVLDQTVIRRNTNNGAGGGVSITSTFFGPVQLIDSRVVDNQASAGGGIWSAGDPVVTMTRSIVSGNRATGDGGGIYHANLFSSPAQLRVVDSVVARNTAGGRGGGIYNDFDAATLLSLEGRTSIVNNDATVTGGGIYNNQGSVLIGSAVTVRSNRPNNCSGVAC